MIDMNALFREQVARRASDVHLKIGRPVLFRIAGDMVPAGGPPVTADLMEDALKQVLLILVDNALVHTPERTPVTLTTSATDAQIVFKVYDSGPGIAPEVLPHIFERFYREQTSRTQGGAGLGLSIAKELIEAQGGTITAESRLGQGSIFAITLPTAAADQPS